MIGSVVFSSCNREPEPIDLIKYMLVQTEYNESFVNEEFSVFNTYNTFYIREDTIGFVSTLSDKEYLINSDVTDFVSPVVDSVRDGFSEAGFQQVGEDENPDFAVNVILLENFNYYQVLNFSGYYPGGYYNYYNYYYPVVTTYYSNYVTLVIQVVDNKNPENGDYPIIWTTLIGDIGAAVDPADRKQRTLEAIGQAFTQSPYINNN